MNAVFAVKNVSNTTLKNMGLHAYNNLSHTINPSLAGTGIKKLENFATQSITNPSITQSIKPAHGVTTTADVDPNRADFQAFTAS